MYNIKSTSKNIKCDIALPYSKSESNRVLIINSLCNSKINIANLSTSDDTVTLERLLNSNDYILDCGSGGTTFRFLLAYLAVTGTEKVITGSERLRSRPIKPLVDALVKLGADITYMERVGFAPLKISKGNFTTQNEIEIEANISSQFISALLLVVPLLPYGLHLTLKGKTLSLPYIRLTLDVMQLFGVASTFTNNIITVKHQNYNPKDYVIKRDWSSASYFYAMAALAHKADIFFEGLSFNSSQADEVIAEIMNQFGVKSEAVSNGVRITKNSHLQPKAFEYNFINCPDLAQTLAFVCVGLGIKAQLTGLDNLSLKETDRIKAIVTEIGKLKTKVHSTENSIILGENKIPDFEHIVFNTYADHRMAMGIAPLALVKGTIVIDAVEDVSKSYPEFWKELENTGLLLSKIPIKLI